MEPRVPALAFAEILARAGIFTDLAPAQLDRVAELCRLEEHAQDNRIYNLGDAAVDLYVLVDGTVRFTIGIGPRQASAGEIIRRGEVFGWAALVEGAQRRIATAYCLTPAMVLAVDGNALLGLMDGDTGMGYRVMKRLACLITGKLTASAAG